MSIEDCIVNYSFCKPTIDEKMRIQSILHNLYYASPSDSVVKLFISKNKNMYECQLRISSPYFMEVVNSRSNDILKSTYLAKKLMSKKIDEWKEGRFTSQAVS